MGNNITEIVFILDKSGSMAGLESDTIGGFNGLIDKQRKQDGKCYVSTVLFDNRIDTIHDRVELSEIKKMTEDDYTVGGCTALIDAIGYSIEHIKTVHKYIRPEDVPERTMFVITTDGLENASSKFSSKEVKKMIKKQKKNGWEFLFIGANIDSVETAGSIGIDADRAVNYRADAKGTSAVFGAVSKAMCCMRASAPLSEDWCEDIAKDYESRN